MADFAALATQIESWEERGAWLTLRHPYTGEPIGGEQPARILLTSPLSKRWQEMERAWQIDRMVSHQGQLGKITESDVVKFERHRLRCYIAATREWENIEREGEPLACTPTNMEWLYAWLFVKNQLAAFFDDLTNFGAPEGTNGQVSANVLEDIEKKSLTGAIGVSQ